MTIEIYWNDLTEEKKNEIRGLLNLEKDDDNNWTFIPIATIEIEDEEVILKQNK